MFSIKQNFFNKDHSRPACPGVLRRTGILRNGVRAAAALALALTVFGSVAFAHPGHIDGGHFHGKHWYDPFNNWDGFHDGFNSGFNNGFNNGFHDGFNSGFHDGYNTRRPYRYLDRYPGTRYQFEVQRIRENPTAYGARIMYLQDNWDLKYLLWAPNGFNKQAARPVIISLHGNDETAEAAFARLYQMAKRYNYALAAPRWGAGDQFMAPQEISDFISRILSEMNTAAGVHADPSMVILHGYDRGANMAGYLNSLTPGRYILTVVDSGPFPALGGAADTQAPGRALTIPAQAAGKLAGQYIYLHSRYEDQAMYSRLDASRAALTAAGAHVELNYTKGLNAGEFNTALSESIVRMFDQAIATK